MTAYDKIYKMDNLFSIWLYSNRLRITYVKQGWLVVWDHAKSPPLRYDCQHVDHEQACISVVNKMQEIQAH